MENISGNRKNKPPSRILLVGIWEIQVLKQQHKHSPGITTRASLRFEKRPNFSINPLKLSIFYRPFSNQIQLIYIYLWKIILKDLRPVIINDSIVKTNTHQEVVEGRAVRHENEVEVEEEDDDRGSNADLSEMRVVIFL